MSIDTVRFLDEPTRSRLLEIYTQAFEPLRTKTATRQTLDNDDLSALFDLDTSIVLIERGSRGEVKGFAAMVSDLKAIPWINPEFFADRYPEQYATGRLLYVPAMAISSKHQKKGAFVSLAKGLAGYAADRLSVLLMDCCTYNIDEEHFPEIIHRVGQWVAPTCHEQLDQQVFWAYEVGERHPTQAN